MNMNTAPASAAPMNEVPMAPVKYAGFWVRYVAYVVDSLILFIPNLIVSLVVGLLALSIFGPTAARIVQYIAEFLVIWIYFVLMTYYAGATLGKMLVGVHVQSDSFGKLSFGKVLLRETIGKFISGLIILIGYIMAAFTGKKQALHDKIAHSVVVYKNPAKPHGAGLVVGIILAVIVPILVFVGILSSVVLVSLNSARQKGQDAQVTEILYQVRPAAEIYYDNNKESYSFAKNCSSGVFSDPNIQSDLSGLANKNVICYAEGTSYAISAPLNATGSSFCVDSTGVTGNGVAVDTGSKASCQMTSSSPY